MVRQQSIGTTPRQVQGNDHATATLHWSNPGFAPWKQHYKLDNIRIASRSAFDNKMTWSDRVANVVKSVASKLSLPRRMQFLPRKQF